MHKPSVYSIPIFVCMITYQHHPLSDPALKDVLESRGVLGEVQAKLRAEVYKALDDQVHIISLCVTIRLMFITTHSTSLNKYPPLYLSNNVQSVPKPDLCHENLLLNELIREYLQYNKYNYTSSVLLAGCALIVSPSNCFIVTSTSYP